MDRAVPDPGIAPDANHDWFSDFAEEEPADDASLRDAAPGRRPDDFASERRLIDPASAIDDWSLGPTPGAAPEPFRLSGASSLPRPASSRAVRVGALAVALVALTALVALPRLAAEVPIPPLPARPVVPLQAEIPAMPAIFAAAPPLTPEPAPPTPAAKPADSPPPAPVPPPLASPAQAAAARAAESPEIDAVLSRYRAAFGALDATQVAEVWPAADRAALERTFGGLAFQSLEFDGCAIEVRNLDAQASCRGRARVVTKAASKTFLEPRRWDFTLRKDERGWVIRSVAAGK